MSETAPEQTLDAPSTEQNYLEAESGYHTPFLSADYLAQPFSGYSNSEEFKSGVNSKVSKTSNKNFLKNVKWSPDGTCLLSSSEDNVLRMFELPRECYTYQFPASPAPLPSPVFRMPEGDSVYDCAWYPKMTSTDPSSCFFVASSRDHPVHTWDAYTGKVRASYRAYNEVDEITAPVSLAFCPDGSRLYGGFNSRIRWWDVNTPGRQAGTFGTNTKFGEGQRGIVSCMAFSRGHVSCLMAAGFFSKGITLFDETSHDMVCVLRGHEGGVTQVMFSQDGYYLFSGARKDGQILCWDVRNTVGVIFSMNRVVKNNQRVSFDIDPTGRYLISGSQDDRCIVYDLQQSGAIVSSFSTDPKDTISCVSCHPSLPLLAFGTGERVISLDESDESENESAVKLTPIAPTDQSVDQLPITAKRRASEELESEKIKIPNLGDLNLPLPLGAPQGRASMGSSDVAPQPLSCEVGSTRASTECSTSSEKEGQKVQGDKHAEASVVIAANTPAPIVGIWVLSRPYEAQAQQTQTQAQQPPPAEVPDTQMTDAPNST